MSKYIPTLREEGLSDEIHIRSFHYKHKIKMNSIWLKTKIEKFLSKNIFVFLLYDLNDKEPFRKNNEIYNDYLHWVHNKFTNNENRWKKWIYVRSI